MQKTSKINQIALDKTTSLVYNTSMKNSNTNKGNDMSNCSTEASRKEATIRIRNENQWQLQELRNTSKELWELWYKNQSQAVRDCILDGIVSASREIEKIEKILG